ncbi:polysaccharide biosynthesis/export family protein [Rubellimicrobium aerolatum]|uniref:Polysaccharide biosynthesis/export family protein n=1 Tax=Rubellimicrobium aerolatum TaxID=490979 RepID=A0ABW0S9F9_9RHOB|nr:polysaccharide biosynthesis/export family protein [Rubellimicrobium aerolatum]MBP1804935.1 polysaccharide export outer membrane protein [Rubellimicrobium aerolatum]
MIIRKTTIATVTAGLLGLGVLGTAQAQDAYRIRPGDVLQIEVIEDPGLNRSSLVSPDGRITVPLAGSVPAAGRTVEQIQSDLVDRLAPNFTAPPNVFVGLAQIAQDEEEPLAAEEPPTIDVYVVGEAGRPGKLSVEPGTTMLQIVAEMGGFSPFAATKRIQLRRTDPATGRETVYGIDYRAIEQGRSGAGSVALADGDVIVVPQRRLFE